MPDAELTALDVIDVGLCDYLDGLRLQEETHRRVLSGTAPSALIIIEHPAVLTLGKHAATNFLKFSEADFEEQGVKVVRIDRGGEVTAHMPGQLVVYPILKLADFKLTPKALVTLIETAVINALAEFGIHAGRDPINPGVWVGHRKICAIGIRIKDRVSMHGLALNVTNSLELFDKIVPCGILGRGVTSMAECLPQSPRVASVATTLVATFKSGLFASQVG